MLARKLDKLLTTETIRIIQQNAPFSELVSGEIQHDGYFVVFRCSHCEHEFQLNIDRYHGWGHFRGGTPRWWRAIRGNV